VAQLPRVAVLHGPESVSPLTLAEAAADLCHLVWVVDSSEPSTPTDSRLLKKIGPVVDVVGLSGPAAAANLRREDPAGIAVFNDEKIVAGATLASQLGLRFHSPATALRLTNKLAQRQAFQAADVPCPRFWELPADLDRAALESVAGAIRYPAVVKPQCGTGSRGTKLVRDPAALRRARRDGRDDAIVEEFLADAAGTGGGSVTTSVSVECAVSAGSFSPLAVTGRFPMASRFRETGFFTPGQVPPTEAAGIVEMAARAVRALGVTDGILNVELKRTPEGPRVIEVNGRPGGPTPAVLRLATGVELLPMALRLSLGRAVASDGPLDCSAIGYLFYRQPPDRASLVTAIEGLDELGARPGVTAVKLQRKVGDTIDVDLGISGFVFSVEGRAADLAELEGTYRAAQSDVTVSFAP
jgi:biotin carboxylase